MEATSSLSGIFKALLQADATVQVRNARALIASFVLPIVLLYALFNNKRGIQLGPADTRVASALTLGMAAVGVISYSLTVARDRERGVFQRLRATPAPAWTILASRLAIQVVAMLALALVVLVAAYVLERFSLSSEAYLLTFVVVLVSSAVFLGIGQALVGLIKSADTVTALTPLAFAPLVALGLFGHSTIFGTDFEMISRWSPGGVVVSLLSSAMQPGSWNGETWWALLASLAYSVLFAGIGIRWFRWSTN
ncbi:MAG TPA: ABC transporter permease [Candidatus Dormibacteraeota bacterium]